MTSSSLWRRLNGVACSILLGSALHAQMGPQPGVVRADRVNVRGKASLQGEVITQLSKGESVVILEEISGAGPKKETEAPPAWLKIKMPANTPVWVNASHVDPASKSVTVRRLNIRGGAGENYSVLGVLDKGSILKEIRTVGDWMEIEAPTNTFGFVAADLIQKSNAPTIAATPVPPVAKTEATGKDTVPPQVKDLSNSPETPAIVPNPTPPTANPLPAPATPTSPAVEVAVPVTAPPKPSPSAVPTNVPPGEAPVNSARPPASADEPLPRRIITREGIVKRARNIQAPDDYQLVSAETGKTINFLVTDKLGFSLKDFVDRKLMVTGEELVDRRWPNTPILDVEDLRIVP